ncbi:Lin1244/Lin1753 domain-containing protein [Bacteroides sp. 224]|uniref:DUF7833 domain-containing protein n=1 Tax=Bacteroides sp. 224 TaxID=2302936 RepID=UPI0013D44A96|nr:Lin1244/Lin1753 domain-containing protein [Bacteroides sp. 224]NDV63761.1 DUF4373 domain-containing protein [Bacteroides sp. 224]
MKENFYFPLETNIVKDERVATIIEKYGAKGMGSYIMLLIELSNHANNRCKLSNIRSIIRAYKLNRNLIEDLIQNHALFELINNEEDGEVYLSSPYLNRLLKRLNEKKNQCAAAGKKGAKTRWKKNGERYNDPITIYNTDDVVILNAEERKRIKSWKEYLAEALNDRTWVECQAMHSGLGDRFLKYEKDIVNFFINHVITHGKDSVLLSLQDVKYYFANFIRQGTITNNRVATQLDTLEQKQKKDNPYRFETVDPLTGERSYYGNIIPQDAPPRPNERAVWNVCECYWE